MTALWTADQAAAATGGTTAGDWAATGVSIDSRTLQPGDLFVALTDARDGHDFVAQALARGAAAAMVSRLPPGVAADAPLLVVPDVLAGLRALAAAARARCAARVIGVTGSVGKTSTKEMLRAALGGQTRLHAAEASYNNHWGVPLTLARMPADTGLAVIEIGMNHPGEIAPLARLARLDLALVTTVAAAHLEAFADLAGIAREKAAILDGLIAGGIAVLPADLEVSPILLDRAAAAGARVVTFGATAGDWRLDQVTPTETATVARAVTPAGPRLFKLTTPGRHLVQNALAVLAAAEALGFDPALTAADLGRWAPPAGRGRRERIVLDAIEELGFDLIDDAFNANPASMAAALDLLALARPRDGQGRVGRGRRIAVLGDMLELGPDEARLHSDLAAHPAMARVDLVHCVGPRMAALYRALPPPRRGRWVAAAADLVPQVRSLADAGDILLVKGSKGSKVSLIVDALRKLGQGGAPDSTGTA